MNRKGNSTVREKKAMQVGDYIYSTKTLTAGCPQ